MTTVRKLKSKVCLVGEKAVGKTSLIRRYVQDVFDDRYLTTIGTKITKRSMTLARPEDDVEVRMDMTIWDIMGEKGFRELLKEAYFYGADGVLAVADITREETLQDLDDWIDSTIKVVGRIPVLIAVNKVDLDDQLAYGTKEIVQVARAFDAPHITTSAKTSENVERAFQQLASMITDSLLGE
jgi:small GTP-binding protein